MAQRKNPELDALHQSILRKMLQLPENKACADCKAPSPRWASTNLGIFLCISCSGIHRKLGTHISQVRSTTLDTWTPAQIAHFKKLGNAKAAAYFEACLPEGFRRPSTADSRQMERFIRDKYEKKRYITVENGGLGGAESRGQQKPATQSNSFAQPKFQTPTTSTLGPRPFQSTTPSHDVRRPMGRKAMPLSYGDTFRSSSIAGPNQVGNGRRKASDARVLGKPGNAIQRASTAREIMKMGFSADIAARAAEAGSGDLQKAVDWVLENCSSAHEPPKKKQEQPIQDLLSFNDADWGEKSNGQKAWAESRIKTHSSTTVTMTTTTTSNVQNDFEDFADFGAFESALPIAQAPKVGPSPTPSVRSNTLGGSLSALYTQGATTPNASISKSPDKQHAVRSQNSESMQFNLGMFDAFQTGLPNTTASTPLSNQATGVSAARGYSSNLFQTSESSSSVATSRLQANGKSSSPFGRSAVAAPIFPNPTSPLRSPISSPLKSGLNIQSTALHTGAQVTNSVRHKSLKTSPPVSHSPPSQSIPSFVSFSKPIQKAPKNESSPPNQPASLSNAYSFKPLNPDLSTPPPPPPPPPPALVGGVDPSLDDVPPPPDGPPPRQDEFPVAKSNNNQANEPDIPEGTPTEGMDENVGGNETEDVGEPEEEDPFAALSMMALSSAKAKKKS